MTCQRIIFALAASLLLGTWSPTTAADDEISRNDRYFEGLRQRGLFGLAESVCLEELARKDLTPSTRLDTTLQFSRTLVEHAQATGGTQQQDLWDRARKVLDQFSTLHPDHPESFRIGIQAGLIPLARGGYLARLADLAPLDRRRRGEALETLQEGIDRLKPLQRRLENPGPLADSQRRQLLATCRWRLAQAHLDRARMMSPGTPDRAADLLAAELTLKKMSPTALGNRLRIARTRLRAQVARQQMDFVVARRILDAAGFEGDDGLLAERAWIELDDGRVTTARTLIEKRLAGPSPPSDELLFLAQRCLGRLWQQAAAGKSPGAADALWERWQLESDRAGRVPGAYWRTRSRRDADLVLSIRRFGSRLARGRHRAISLFQAGRTDEALAAFAEVIQAARTDGQFELAGELAFTRGSVLVRNGRFELASRSFRDVARQKPVHPRAPSAHLLWAWCLGQVQRRQNTPARQQAYREALVEHRSRFPKHATAAEATWLLASFENDRQHPRLARELWLAIPPGHQRAAAARRRVAASFENELENLDRDDPARREKLDLAIRTVESLVVKLPAPPRGWTTDEAAVVISLARLGLKRTRPDYRQIDQLLEAILTRGPPVITAPGQKPDAVAVAIRDNTRQLRVLLLAGQGRLDQARKLVASFAGRPDDLLALLDGLDQVATTTRTADRRRLGALQLQAAESLDQQRNTLDPANRQRLDRCLAQAFVAAGFPLRAVAVYERLVKAAPRDWKPRTRLAEVRLTIGTASQTQAAITDWRTAERLLSPGSDDWMIVRLGTLRALKQAGRAAECRQLLGVTRLLYPEKGTAAVRADLKRLAVSLKPKTDPSGM